MKIKLFKLLTHYPRATHASVLSNIKDIIKIKYSSSSDFTTLLNTVLYLSLKSAKRFF